MKTIKKIWWCICVIVIVLLCAKALTPLAEIYGDWVVIIWCGVWVSFFSRVKSLDE